jgi:hypothetical protein
MQLSDSCRSAVQSYRVARYPELGRRLSTNVVDYMHLEKQIFSRSVPHIHPRLPPNPRCVLPRDSYARKAVLDNGDDRDALRLFPLQRREGTLSC